MSIGGVGPTGGAQGVGGSQDPQQAMSDMMNNLEKLKDCTQSSDQQNYLNAIGSDVKVIGANIGSFPNLDPKFKDDIIDLANNGPKANGGLLAQMMQGPQVAGMTPTTSIPICANAIIAESEGDEGASNLEGNMVNVLQSIIKAGGTPSEQLNSQLANAAIALAMLKPPNLPPSFSADLSDLLSKGPSQDGGLLGQFFAGGRPHVSPESYCKAIVAEYEGPQGESDLKGDLTRELNDIISNGGKFPTGEEDQFVQNAQALALLNPGGKFGSDLQDLLVNGPEGKGLIAQLLHNPSAEIAQSILTEMNS